MCGSTISERKKKIRWAVETLAIRVRNFHPNGPSKINELGHDKLQDRQQGWGVQILVRACRDCVVCIGASLRSLAFDLAYRDSFYLMSILWEWSIIIVLRRFVGVSLKIVRYCTPPICRSILENDLLLMYSVDLSDYRCIEWSWHSRGFHFTWCNFDCR